jgi:hypothetical protein
MAYDRKAVITANTEVQLRTTRPELAKWLRLALHKHWFNFGATSITARDPKNERTWHCDIVPWSETNTEAFAGLHNRGNHRRTQCSSCTPSEAPGCIQNAVLELPVSTARRANDSAG